MPKPEDAQQALTVQGWTATAGSDAASGQDPHRGRPTEGFDFLGYHFPRPEMAAGEEPEEVQGHDPGQDATH